MTLLGDRCLVKLAPRPGITDGGILTVAEYLPPPVSYGKVIEVGPKVRDVAVGDVIAFSPESGENIEGLFLVPHVAVHEREVLFAVERS